MHQPSPSRFALAPSAVGSITRLAVARVRAAGRNPESLMREAGITARQVDDREVRIDVQSQVRFLQIAAEALGDGLLGFHLAEEFELREMGLLYYVLASPRTLGESLQRAARYASTVNEGILLECQQRHDLSIGITYRGVPRHTDRHQIEFVVTALVRTCQRVTESRLRPSRIALVHARCDESTKLEAFLGREIEFGAERDRITFAAEANSLPVVSADPYLYDSLVRYWDEVSRQRARRGQPLRSAVENAILPLLPHGKARVGQVAQSLGLSQRTLARRLSAESLTFGQVFEELKADLARRHLRDSSLSISEIAWLLGFQEASAFTHAFKRWTGETPTRWRRDG